ncbi:MAG: exodeoxyribonuclease VII small subunit [Bacilli bacterium]
MSEKKTNLTFEQKTTKLDKIVEELSNSTLGLNESLKLYEEAQLLIKDLERDLKDAKEKIEKFNN